MDLRKAIRDLATLAIGVLVVDVVFESNLDLESMLPKRNWAGSSELELSNSQPKHVCEHHPTGKRYQHAYPDCEHSVHNCGYSNTSRNLWGGQPHKCRLEGQGYLNKEGRIGPTIAVPLS